MKILYEYTIDFIKRNKRSTIAIIISIIISTTLITTLSSIIYILQMDEISMIKKEQGDWHGELFEEVKGQKLKYVLAHPNVETIMIKGSWQIGKLDGEELKRPYIIFQNLTEEYFSSMISEAIIKGRAAENSSELVVSELFLKENPQYELGSNIDLPIGRRSYDGHFVDILSSYHEEEVFIQDSVKTFQIVGISDTNTSSVTPAYYAMGYMAIDEIKDDDNLTIYMRFKNPRKTYTDLPQIAGSVGLEKDEYDNFPLRYNAPLLSKYFIFSKTTFPFEFIFQSFIWSVIILAVLVVSLFVIIIHAAFSISTNSRIKQLGMLKSIGATPKQIKMSVLFEAFLLSAISIPIGIVLGNLLCILYIKIANMLNSSIRDDVAVFQFSWLVVIISTILALITVWFSASIPVKKMNKLLPIEAIKQSGNIKLKKTKRNFISSKLFGITGELAVNSFSVNKRANITSLLSLILSFVLLIVFLNVFVGMEDAKKDIYGDSEYWKLTDISFALIDGRPMNASLEHEIRNMEHIEHIMFYSNTAGSMWVDENKQSKETEAIFGFEEAAKTYQYPIYQLDGKYRLRAEIFGLDDSSFKEYCSQIGADYKDYYNRDDMKYIIVNTQEDTQNSTKRFPKYIPLLDIQTGESLKFSSKIRDSDEESFEEHLSIGYITDKYPELGECFTLFTVGIVIPMEVYQEFVSHFNQEKTMNSLFTSAIIKTDGTIDKPLKEIESILSENYSSGDYKMNDILAKRTFDDISRKMLTTITYFLTFLLVVIGLLNTFSTVTNSMQMRKKEFAMLRSVGIAPKEFFKLFVYEALYFTFIPLLTSIIFSTILIIMFLNSMEIYFMEYIKYIPVMPFIIYTFIVLACVLGIYVYSFKSVEKDNIVDYLRNELL